MKTMSSTIISYNSNNTHLALIGVLGHSVQVYGLYTESAAFATL